MDLRKILVLDLATTDLKPQLGDIIEMGAVLLNSGGVIEKVIDTPIKSTRPVEEWRDCWCLRNTDLTVEAVLAGKTLEEIRDSLQALFRDYSVTSYNRDFDFGYLAWDVLDERVYGEICKRRGLSPDDFVMEFDEETS